MNYIQGTASIEYGFEYPCLFNPNNQWNGWDIPIFTEEVFNQILSDAKISGQFHDEGYFYSHDDLDDPIASKISINDTVYFEFQGWIWTCNAIQDQNNEVSQ